MSAKAKEQPEINDDPNQPELPGTGPTIEQYIEDVKQYETAKNARIEMSAVEVAAKKLRDKGTKYHRQENPDLFKPDPDNDDTLIFKQGGVRVNVKVTETETITSKLDDSPEDETDD